MQAAFGHLAWSSLIAVVCRRRAFAVFGGVAACLLTSASPALSAESELANRNLGLKPAAFAKAKAGPDTSAKPAIPREEIEVIADPEDFARRRESPLDAFAKRLDGSRLLTPAEKAQRFLSFFLGGPMPKNEPSIEERRDARVKHGGRMMATPGGTLQ